MPELPWKTMSGAPPQPGAESGTEVVVMASRLTLASLRDVPAHLIQDPGLSSAGAMARCDNNPATTFGQPDPAPPVSPNSPPQTAPAGDAFAAAARLAGQL
jgi:hypothetical protein